MKVGQTISFDWISIVMYLLLVFLGWLTIYSSSYSPENHETLSISTIHGKQALFIIISLFIGGFILLTDLKIIIRVGYVMYIACIIALILVLFFGKEVGGAKAWFKFGNFGLQPAEFAKIGTILAVAKYIHTNKLNLGETRTLFKLFLLVFFPCFLILQQPDAGSTLVYGSLIIPFFREGFPIKYIFFLSMLILLFLLTIIGGVNFTMIILVTLCLMLAYFLKKNKKNIFPALIIFIFSTLIINIVNYTYEDVLRPHQKERIDIIIGKEKNTLGSGYNLNQSLIAIGSGGWLGKGYLNGTQTKFNFVPEQNTDFIFCTIGEEFGFFGSLILIFLFIAFIGRLIALSEKQSSRFSRIIGYSTASIIFAHTIINISMTIGMMPVIGIPLPFFSYGGSSLLAFSILLFIFLRLDSERTIRF